MCSGRTTSACLYIWASLAMPLIAADMPGIRAVTRPSADLTLTFVQPGCIAEILIEQGDDVEAGQILVRQDDTLERIQMARARAQSRSTTQIRASEASLDQKRVDLEKIEKAAESNATTKLEVEHARLDVKIAQLSSDLSKFERKQAIRQYREAKKRLRNMSLRSPVCGRIEQIHVEVGEAVNALEETVRVVRTAPLWIEVPVPLEHALKLAKGSPAKVTFHDARNVFSEQGKVSYVAVVADTASKTLQVRVEVPNQANRPAGEHVLVLFNENEQPPRLNAEAETQEEDKGNEGQPGAKIGNEPKDVEDC